MCGAGNPNAAPPPPPPDTQAAQGDLADYWAAKHPDATTAAAFRAGYMEGLHAARTQHTQQQSAAFTQEGKVARTILAALAHFRDQVLADIPNEVTDGEWLSVQEVDQLIARLQAQG